MLWRVNHVTPTGLHSPMYVVWVHSPGDHSDHSTGNSRFPGFPSNGWFFFHIPSASSNCIFPAWCKNVLSKNEGLHKYYTPGDSIMCSQTLHSTTNRLLLQSVVNFIVILSCLLERQSLHQAAFFQTRGESAAARNWSGCEYAKIIHG